MSDDNVYSEHHESQPPGMSSGTKIILISLGVLGVLAVACCGGGIWWVRSNFDVDMSTDPAVVRETQEGILDLEVPERFEPQQSMRMKIMVANMEMAMFKAKTGEVSQLALMKMIFTMEQMNQQQAEMQFNQQNPGSAQLDESSSETRKYTVDGKEISVKFTHGTLRQSENAPAGQIGKEWFSVSSMISVDGGMVMLEMTGPEEEYNEEEIENIINSIHFLVDE